MRRVEARLRLDGETCGMRRQVEDERRGERKGEREASSAGSNLSELGRLEEKESLEETRVFAIEELSEGEADMR